MNRRKIKKQIKKVDDVWFKNQAMHSLKMIRYWEKYDSPYSKQNMRVLTHNFYHRGKLLI